MKHPSRPWPRLLCLVVLIAGIGCASGTSSGTRAETVSRSRAIELARPHVDFAAERILVEKTRQEGRAVWQITFQGPELVAGSPLRKVMIVVLDRDTGEVVSLARD